MISFSILLSLIIVNPWLHMYVVFYVGIGKWFLLVPPTLEILWFVDEINSFGYNSIYFISFDTFPYITVYGEFINTAFWSQFHK